MDKDYCIFNSKHGARYVYDSNTNTAHPIPDDVDDAFVCKIYDTPDGVLLDGVGSACDTIGAFIRYVNLWRKNTDAFVRKPRQPRFRINNIEAAQKSQLSSSLAWDLILITSEECNMRCAYCVHEEGLYPNRREHSFKKMDMETTRKAIDLYLNMNKQEKVMPFKLRALNIMFYGGEAFLNWDVVKDGISHARKNYDGHSELHIGITTNLTLLQREHLPFLRDNKVFLNVSLDGPKEEHDRYRVYADKQPTHNDVMNNLAIIRDFDADYYNLYVKAAVTINGNTDINKVADFFENTDGMIKIHSASLLKDMEDSTFHKTYPFDKDLYISASTQFGKRFEQACLDGATFDKGEPFYAFHYEYLSSLFNAPHFKRYEKQWFTGMCAPCRKMTVAPDGNIHMCERIGMQWPVGHIDYGFSDEKLVKFYNDFYDSLDECGECWARNRCSLCPAEVDSNKDSYFENRCDKAREKAKTSLQDLYSILETKPNIFINEFPYY